MSLLYVGYKIELRVKFCLKHQKNKLLNLDRNTSQFQLSKAIKRRLVKNQEKSALLKESVTEKKFSLLGE